MSKSNKMALGRGLESLIPTNFDQNLLLDKHERIQNVFITDLDANPDQPRRHFDETAITELAASIKRYGVLQPLIVMPTSDKGYVIVAGERRWRAAKKANIKQVPVIVRDRTELDQLEVALVENVQRVDLSGLEQAVSIERLHQQFNLSYQEIAKRLGKAETTVSNIVRLLGLPEDAREALSDNKVTEGHARAILALKAHPTKQKELLKHILTSNWTVRQAEQFASSVKQGKTSRQATKQSSRSETLQTRQLAKHLNTTIKLHRGASGGALEIHFANDEELDRLLKRLGKS